MIAGLYKMFDHWHRQGTVWLYSDPHFDEDQDLRKPFPHRPSAEEQVRMINSRVGKHDTLIILGDVGSLEWAAKLKGYKILVCGNHDIGPSKYEGVFQEVYAGPVMIGEKLILSHEPLSIDWAFNIHGHTHTLKKNAKGHLCVCSDVIGYMPVNLNQFVKSGRLQEVESIHRATIDEATKRKAKREKKYGC